MTSINLSEATPKRILKTYYVYLMEIIFPRRRSHDYKEYRQLCDILFDTPFEYTLTADDNRLSDGEQLRDWFCDENHIPDSKSEILIRPCSMLEMLIALSRKAAMNSFDHTEPGEWFLIFVNNCGLGKFNKERFERDPGAPRKIYDLCYKVNHRQYGYNGRGGYFPLSHPYEDQRKVEMWYQLNDYINEREPLENYIHA